MEKIRAHQSIKLLFSIICLSMIIISGSKLFEAERTLIFSQDSIYGTPTKIITPKKANEILVFVAHGFAGSSNFMRPIAVSLGQSGFTTIRYDFLGHGENVNPYTGSITEISGATQSFIAQTNNVIDHYKNLYKPKRIILLGHSMASDIIVRTALSRNDIDSVIGVSTYTDAIGSDKPNNILILNGEWEPRLKLKAYDILTKIGIARPSEDTLYGSFNDGSAIKVISIKNADHVGILFSKRTQEEIGRWVNGAFMFDKDFKKNEMGVWIAVLLLSIFFCIFFMISALPKRPIKKFSISFKKFLIINLLSLLLTPLVLYLIRFDIIEYTAHNYLLQHLFLYSLICFTCIPTKSLKIFFMENKASIFFALIALYGLVFGTALDSYISTFLPRNLTRLLLLITLAMGTIPYMVFLQILYQSRSNAWLMTAIAKINLLISIILAIAINFSELFLLGYAILLFLFFLLVFGFLSNQISKRTNSQMSVAVSNGVMLAWTYATTLPLYIV